MKKNIALIIFSFVFSFIIVEVALRVFGLIPQIDQSNAHLLFERNGESYKLKKGVKDISFAGSFISSNQFGFRDNTMKVEKSNQRRIAFIGDSWGFGWGLKQSQSIPKIIQNKIDANVLNFSIPGFNVSDYLFVVKNELPKFDIDEVVILLHLNDILELDEKKSFKKKENSKNESVAFKLLYRALLLPMAEKFKFTNRTSVNMFNKSYAKGGQKFKKYKKNLSEIVENTISKNIKLKVFILPIPFSNSETYPLGAINAKIISIFKTYDVLPINLVSVYKGRKKSEMVINSYDPHPNEYASELIAKEILKHL